jgi:hypothetical protein
VMSTYFLNHSDWWAASEQNHLKQIRRLAL